MKNLHLLLFPVLTLFAVVAAAQTASESPKNPASTQDLAAPTQSSSAPHLALFPAPEVPPEEASKSPASTQDLAATPPSQPSSASHVELFPIMEIPPDEVPLSTVSTDLSATPPSESSSASRVDLFPIIEVPPDELPKSTVSIDLGAASPGESPSASHVELFPMPDIPAEEVEAPAPLTPAEIELQAQIQSAISKDPTLNGDSVNVSLSAGGIELSGTVASVRARLAASRLAKSYAANRKVVDKITIAARHETPTDPAPAKVEIPGTAHQNP